MQAILKSNHYNIGQLPYRVPVEVRPSHQCGIVFKILDSTHYLYGLSLAASSIVILIVRSNDLLVGPAIQVCHEVLSDEGTAHRWIKSQSRAVGTLVTSSQVDALLPPRFGQPLPNPEVATETKCDCGAQKCNTTHASWCSTRRTS